LRRIYINWRKRPSSQGTGQLAAGVKKPILAAMPLTPRQRRDLLRIERSRDAETITTAIQAVRRDNPTVSLLEIEMAFRAAAGAA